MDNVDEESQVAGAHSCFYVGFQKCLRNANLFTNYENYDTVPVGTIIQNQIQIRNSNFPNRDSGGGPYFCPPGFQTLTGGSKSKLTTRNLEPRGASILAAKRTV